MDDFANALDAGLLQFSEGSFIGTGGFIDTPNQRINIRHVAPIVEAKDLSTVPIEKVNGKPVTLGDVGNLVIDHQPLFGDGVINDGPGLMMIVEKLPWANTLEVTEGVEEAIQDMQPGLPGMQIDTTIFRPATFIEESIDNLTKALLIGALLVIFVLIFFLFEWRAALISVYLDSDVADRRGIVLYLRDTTINVMVLAGLVIALGVVVDDAIIDVENIVRRLRQHRQEGSRRSTASVDSRGLARGPKRDRLRDADHRRGDGADLLPDRPDRRVLPAPGGVLRPGRRGLAGRGADRHAGDVPDPPRERARSRRRESPLTGGSSAATSACWRRSSRRPRRRVRRRRRSRSSPASRWCRSSGRTSCPASRSGTS